MMHFFFESSVLSPQSEHSVKFFLLRNWLESLQ